MERTPNENAKHLSPLLKIIDVGWVMASAWITGHGPDDELIHQFIAETKDGQLQLYATPWANEEEKQGILHLLRQQFAKENVVRYAMVSEVWIARYKEGDPRATDPDRPMPSQDPNRIEALMVLGVDPGAGEVLHYSAEIFNHGQGVNRSLGERENRVCTRIAGQMTELLGPVTPRTIN